MTLTAEHAVRLAEVRKARTEGRQIEPPPAKPRQPKPVCMDTDFAYVVLVSRHRIGGPYYHRWQAARKASDVDGAEVKRVPAPEELTTD